MDVKNNIATLKITIQKLASHPTWGLFTAIGIALVTNILTVRYIYSLQTDLQSLYGQDLIGQNYIQTARIKLLTIGKEMSMLFLLKDDREKALTIRNISTDKQEVESFIRKSAPLYRSKKGRVMFRNATRMISECSSIIDTFIDLSRRSNTGRAAGVILDAMKNGFANADSALDKLDDMKMKHDIRLYKNINYQLTLSVMFTLCTLAFTIAVKLVIYKRNKRTSVRRALAKIS